MPYASALRDKGGEKGNGPQSRDMLIDTVTLCELFKRFFPSLCKDTSTRIILRGASAFITSWIKRQQKKKEQRNLFAVAYTFWGDKEEAAHAAADYMCISARQRGRITTTSLQIRFGIQFRPVYIFYRFISPNLTRCSELIRALILFFWLVRWSLLIFCPNAN